MRISYLRLSPMKHLLLIVISSGLFVSLSNPLLASDSETRKRVAGLKGSFDCAYRQGLITQEQWPTALQSIEMTLDKRGISRSYLSDWKTIKASKVFADELIRLKVDCSDTNAIERSLNYFSERALNRLLDLYEN